MVKISFAYRWRVRRRVLESLGCCAHQWVLWLQRCILSSLQRAGFSSHLWIECIQRERGGSPSAVEPHTHTHTDTHIQMVSGEQWRPMCPVTTWKQQGSSLSTHPNHPFKDGEDAFIIVVIHTVSVERRSIREVNTENWTENTCVQFGDNNSLG